MGKVDNLERLGILVDTAENFMAGTKLNLPDNMRVDALKFGLKEIRDEIKRIYLAMGGEDVWTLGDYMYDEDK